MRLRRLLRYRAARPVRIGYELLARVRRGLRLPAADAERRESVVARRLRSARRASSLPSKPAPAIASLLPWVTDIQGLSGRFLARWRRFDLANLDLGRRGLRRCRYHRRRDHRLAGAERRRRPRPFPRRFFAPLPRR